MLDSKDLELLRSMMQEVVSESEARMTAKIEESETRMTAKIEESETRMTAKIEESETRMTTKIEESETRMTARIEESEARMSAKIDSSIAASESKLIAYIESDVMPRFGRLADGHKLLLETLAPKSRVEELEEEIAFLKPLVMSMLADIEKLKKAQ